MSIQEGMRFRVCQQLIDGVMSESEAAGRLELSVRQVRRLKKRASEEGLSGLAHRSRGRASPHRRPASERDRIRQLYRDRYSGWNMTHFTQRLAEQHGVRVSRETVRGLLKEEASRPRRRRRRRHRRWRPRRHREGELVQLDASTHAWLGDDGPRCVLLCAIDDATSKVLWAEFFDGDGVLPNLTVMKRIVQRHGVPSELYVDQHSIYFLDAEALTAARQRGQAGLTQFGRVMKQLGVRMIRARSPQAKGRVERSFRTLQDRLIKELADAGIKDIAGANRYLSATFIPGYNRRYGVPAQETTLAFVKMDGQAQYNELFCLRESRQVQNDYTISWHSQLIQLTGGAGLRAGHRVEVRTWLNGSIHVYFKGVKVPARRLRRPTG